MTCDGVTLRRGGGREGEGGERGREGEGGGREGEGGEEKRGRNEREGGRKINTLHVHVSLSLTTRHSTCKRDKWALNRNEKKPMIEDTPTQYPRQTNRDVPMRVPSSYRTNHLLP